MKRYQKEALLNPIKNKLYLEDLAISIPMFESAIRNSTIELKSGWLDKEEVNV